MSVPAFAELPPPGSAAERVVTAVQKLPLAKQAEIYWRLLTAAANNDEQEMLLLRHTLRALVDPDGWPRFDPATARTATVEEFRAEFPA